MKKRFFILLIILMLAMILPAVFTSCAYADVNDYKFVKNKDGYTLTSVDGLRRTVIIPDKYENEPVTEIGAQAFYNNDSVRSLTIPNTVKVIGNEAFSGCVDLREVHFDEGGTCALGDEAFSRCPLLETVEFKGSVFSIGESAFYNCVRLGKVVMDEKVTKIGVDAFKNCESAYIDAPDGSYARSYAEETHISTGIAETDLPTYLYLAGAVAIGIAFSVAFRIYDKKKRQKIESGHKNQENP